MQALKNPRHLAVDILGISESVRALADPDRAHMACPVVNVLKQLKMQGQVVRKIKIAVRPGFVGAGKEHRNLIFIKIGLILNIQLVPQNSGAELAQWILLRCVDHNYADFLAANWALMRARLSSPVRLLLAASFSIRGTRGERRMPSTAAIFSARLLFSLPALLLGDCGTFFMVCIKYASPNLAKGIPRPNEGPPGRTKGVGRFANWVTKRRFLDVRSFEGQNPEAGVQSNRPADRLTGQPQKRQHSAAIGGTLDRLVPARGAV